MQFVYLLLIIDNKKNMPQKFEKPIPIDKEVSWDKSVVLTSKTDVKGNIEFANEAFIDVCGYEDYELIDTPHSIVRHPDMPKILFKVIWDKLKAGEKAVAIFKNLAKSGRYFWVYAEIEPMFKDNNKVQNYLAKYKSVSEDLISKSIEPFYKRLMQIENVSGLNYSEKYLIGFLEEKQKDYFQYIQECALSDGVSIPNDNETPIKKGFFFRGFLD